MSVIEKTPQYWLTCQDDGKDEKFQLKVNLPGVSGVSELDVIVKPNLVTIHVEGRYRLELPIDPPIKTPPEVLRFVKKTSQLKAVLVVDPDAPLAAAAAALRQAAPATAEHLLDPVFRALPAAPHSPPAPTAAPAQAASISRPLPSAQAPSSSASPSSATVHGPFAMAPAFASSARAAPGAGAPTASPFKFTVPASPSSSSRGAAAILGAAAPSASTQGTSAGRAAMADPSSTARGPGRPGAATGAGAAAWAGPGQTFPVPGAGSGFPGAWAVLDSLSSGHEPDGLTFWSCSDVVNGDGGIGRVGAGAGVNGGGDSGSGNVGGAGSANGWGSVHGTGSCDPASSAPGAGSAVAGAGGGGKGTSFPRQVHGSFYEDLVIGTSGGGKGKAGGGKAGGGSAASSGAGGGQGGKGAAATSAAATAVGAAGASANGDEGRKGPAAGRDTKPGQTGPQTTSPGPTATSAPPPKGAVSGASAAAAAAEGGKNGSSGSNNISGSSTGSSHQASQGRGQANRGSGTRTTTASTVASAARDTAATRAAKAPGSASSTSGSGSSSSAFGTAGVQAGTGSSSAGVPAANTPGGAAESLYAAGKAYANREAACQWLERALSAARQGDMPRAELLLGRAVGLCPELKEQLTDEYNALCDPDHRVPSPKGTSPRQPQPPYADSNPGPSGAKAAAEAQEPLQNDQHRQQQQQPKSQPDKAKARAGDGSNGSSPAASTAAGRAGPAGPATDDDGGGGGDGGAKAAPAGAATNGRPSQPYAYSKPAEAVPLKPGAGAKGGRGAAGSATAGAGASGSGTAGSRRGGAGGFGTGKAKQQQQQQQSASQQQQPGAGAKAGPVPQQGQGQGQGNAQPSQAGAGAAGPGPTPGGFKPEPAAKPPPPKSRSWGWGGGRANDGASASKGGDKPAGGAAGGPPGSGGSAADDAERKWDWWFTVGMTAVKNFLEPLAAPGWRANVAVAVLFLVYGALLVPHVVIMFLSSMTLVLYETAGSAREAKRLEKICNKYARWRLGCACVSGIPVAGALYLVSSFLWLLAQALWSFFFGAPLWLAAAQSAGLMAVIDNRNNPKLGALAPVPVLWSLGATIGWRVIALAIYVLAHLAAPGRIRAAAFVAAAVSSCRSLAWYQALPALLLEFLVWMMLSAASTSSGSEGAGTGGAGGGGGEGQRGRGRGWSHQGGASEHHDVPAGGRLVPEHVKGASEDVARVLAARDHFAVLGLSYESADVEALTDEAVRSAYKRLQLKVHPDKAGPGAPGAEHASKRVNEAYALLQTADGRKKVLAALRASSPSPGAASWGPGPARSHYHQAGANDAAGGGGGGGGAKVSETETLMRCFSCGDYHPAKLLSKGCVRVRYCSECNCYHDASELDVWIWEDPRAIFLATRKLLLCYEGEVWDVTEMGHCCNMFTDPRTGRRIPANTHFVPYKLSSSDKPGSGSSGGGGGSSGFRGRGDKGGKDRRKGKRK